MRSTTIRLMCLTVILMALLAATPCLGAGLFVDMDGDGIDDKLIDFKDGYFLEDGPATTELTGSQVVNPFAELQDTAPVDLPQTNEDAFAARRFNARFLCQNRRDFDADFGDATSGGGSSGGKTCVGGVCF
ncbi:hypothetical protein GF377_04125 [candidate division GN15 bacterium]|nr:hypothetical protein [candidate division GN15 bacterium]